jgi:PAS domain S-box-containing protein
MTAPSNQQLLSNLRRFTRFASLVTIALGATVLTGWAADIASLTSIIPGMAKIEANAGLAFLFAGLALWLLRDGPSGDAANRLRFLPIALALFVSLVGILTLSQDWLGWSPGIDQFLFRDSGLPGAAHPGRMAPHSAISFVFLGLALAFLDYRTRRRFPPAQIPAVLAGGIAYLNLLVHVLRPFAPSRLASESAMSLQTAVIFAIFSAGVLAARAEGGLVGLFASDSPGGFLLRRFLPLMLIVPLPVSWLRLQGQKHGWWGLEFGVVIPAAATVLFFFILIVWTSKSLNRLDAARESALMTLRKSERSLRRLADRLQMLHKIDLNILEAQTPQEIAGAALKQIAALIPCDRTSLVLFPARGDQAEFLAVWERAPLGPPAGSTARMEDFTILENPPRERYVENLAAWPARTALLNELLRHGVRSVLTIPLTFAHQQIGELNFCSLPVAAFEPEHIEIAQELAAQLAVALHNARVREELRQSEGNFRSLFENSPLGIYRSSLEGKFLTVNPAMVQMLGYASEPELIALDMGKDIYADPKKREEMMRAEDVRQEFHDLEVEWRRMDGSVITVGLTGRPIVDADGTVEAFEVIAEDLTHRRLLEEQLRAAQKMEAI